MAAMFRPGQKEMPNVVSFIYANHSFDRTAQADVQEIANKINLTFAEVIRNSSWIDNNTKELLIEKLQRITTKFGYSGSLFNMTSLEHPFKYVPDLALNSSFLEVYARIRNNAHIKQLEKLREGETDDGVWIIKKTLDDCYYCGSTLKLDFPMEFFQAPFYSHGLPRSLNYGSFGAAFAHQLFHDFHTEGKCRYYGGTPCDVFGSDSYCKCNTSAECFHRLYKNTTEPVYTRLVEAALEKYLNEGKNETAKLAEIYYIGGFPEFTRRRVDANIADSSGLKMALLAYQKLLEEECDGVDTRLDGLEELSGMQLFYIGRAMTLCTTLSEEGLLELMTSNMEGPNVYRINLTMQNDEGFAQAFNCSKDSAMYREAEERCSLW
uniref:Putative peptidase family m13 includes neprilysin n=1 Tax=Amblyomma cajennense TaxID=34607 RepID=A0A023FJF8_AMBCJ